MQAVLIASLMRRWEKESFLYLTLYRFSFERCNKKGMWYATVVRSVPMYDRTKMPGRRGYGGRRLLENRTGIKGENGAYSPT